MITIRRGVGSAIDQTAYLHAGAQCVGVRDAKSRERLVRVPPRAAVFSLLSSRQRERARDRIRECAFTRDAIRAAIESRSRAARRVFRERRQTDRENGYVRSVQKEREIEKAGRPTGVGERQKKEDGLVRTAR